MTSPDVLLATCQDWPEGEPGHEALDEALAARGITFAWHRWDDPLVEWSEARLVAVRSAWDYDARIADFLGWAHRVGPGLLHGVDVFRWNTDKSYLLDLARLGVPIVPSVLPEDLVELRAAVGRFGTSVVKPRVGAGGRGMQVIWEAESYLPVRDPHYVVQPLVHSIFTEGELSVFVIDGRPVSSVRKVASRRDVRVHEQYGGTTSEIPLDPDLAVQAAEAIAACGELLGVQLVYGRVDFLFYEGRYVVSEVELTEPGLYLDVLPRNGEVFAAALAELLGR